MARGKMSWEYADNGTDIIIRKDRGRLTLDDIWEFLHRREQTWAHDGKLAAWIFRVDSDRDASFDMFQGEDTGDSVVLIMVEDDSYCPFCGKNRLFPQYCPGCGEKVAVPRMPGDRT